MAKPPKKKTLKPVWKAVQKPALKPTDLKHTAVSMGAMVPPTPAPEEPPLWGIWCIYSEGYGAWGMDTSTSPELYKSKAEAFANLHKWGGGTPTPKYTVRRYNGPQNEWVWYISHKIQGPYKIGGFIQRYWDKEVAEAKAVLLSSQTGSTWEVKLHTPGPAEVPDADPAAEEASEPEEWSIWCDFTGDFSNTTEHGAWGTTGHPSKRASYPTREIAEASRGNWGKAPKYTVRRYSKKYAGWYVWAKEEPTLTAAHKLETRYETEASALAALAAYGYGYEIRQDVPPLPEAELEKEQKSAPKPAPTPPEPTEAAEESWGIWYADTGVGADWCVLTKKCTTQAAAQKLLDTFVIQKHLYSVHQIHKVTEEKVWGLWFKGNKANAPDWFLVEGKPLFEGKTAATNRLAFLGSAYELRDSTVEDPDLDPWGIWYNGDDMGGWCKGLNKKEEWFSTRKLAEARLEWWNQGESGTLYTVRPRSYDPNKPQPVKAKEVWGIWYKDGNYWCQKDSTVPGKASEDAFFSTKKEAEADAEHRGAANDAFLITLVDMTKSPPVPVSWKTKGQTLGELIKEKLGEKKSAPKKPMAICHECGGSCYETLEGGLCYECNEKLQENPWGVWIADESPDYPEDIPGWCYKNDGETKAFYPTKEEAEAFAKSLKKKFKTSTYEVRLREGAKVPEAKPQHWGVCYKSIAAMMVEAIASGDK